MQRGFVVLRVLSFRKVNILPYLSILKISLSCPSASILLSLCFERKQLTVKKRRSFFALFVFTAALFALRWSAQA
jgi:hypothetical protein